MRCRTACSRLGGWNDRGARRAELPADAIARTGISCHHTVVDTPPPPAGVWSSSRALRDHDRRARKYLGTSDYRSSLLKQCQSPCAYRTLFVVRTIATPLGITASTWKQEDIGTIFAIGVGGQQDTFLHPPLWSPQVPYRTCTSLRATTARVITKYQNRLDARYHWLVLATIVSSHFTL